MSLAACCLALIAFPSEAAGYRELSVEGLNVGVWYPSDAPEAPQRIGPFDAEYARNARPVGENLEIIVFSHGVNGRFRNHRLTARALANEGYVVAGPDHRTDHRINGSEIPAALADRAGELALAVEALRREPDFAGRLAERPVHGVGYSLGGATVALASGLGFDMDAMRTHCVERGTQDPEFCGGGRIVQSLRSFFRLLRSLRDESRARDRWAAIFPAPVITGQAALIAPVAQGLVLGDEELAADSFAVFAIEGDVVAKPEFHARPLRELLSAKAPTSWSEFPGHHYAFIAPFPKRLADKERIPAAIDPPGFSRPDFLSRVNQAILSFFGTQ